MKKIPRTRKESPRTRKEFPRTREGVSEDEEEGTQEVEQANRLYEELKLLRRTLEENDEDENTDPTYLPRRGCDQISTPLLGHHSKEICKDDTVAEIRQYIKDRLPSMIVATDSR